MLYATPGLWHRLYTLRRLRSLYIQSMVVVGKCTWFITNIARYLNIGVVKATYIHVERWPIPRAFCNKAGAPFSTWLPL